MFRFSDNRFLDNKGCHSRLGGSRLGGRSSAAYVAAIFACHLLGCQRPPESPPAVAPSQARPTVTLRVGIVNAPGDDSKNGAGLIAAVGRLRGEWTEAYGGQMEVVSLPASDASSLAKIDLLVFSSKRLAHLCEQGLLRPVRKGVLEGDEYNANDIFPVVRNRLANFGQQSMALPLSVQIPELSTSTHGAMLLLVRAAPAAWDPRRDGVLFEPHSMEPRIAELSFVQALEQIVKKKGPGKHGEQEPSVVSVLGLEGMLAGVTASSRNAAGAFRLLAWIASAEISGQLLSATDQYPVRMSHLAKPTQFFSQQLDRDTVVGVVVGVKAALSRSDCLVIPRIPGIDDYLQALQKAVETAVAGTATPQAALAAAAREWEAITARLGRDKQMQAYLRHLNLAE